jgi:hypothetical protein
MDGAAEDDIQNPYDRMADIAARRRAAEEERLLSQRRLNQILTGTANQFVLWRHYNLRRYYNLGVRIREKVYDIYKYLETPEQRAEFHESMMDGSLVDGLRTAANMHTSGMLEHNKRRRARADAAAATAAAAAATAAAATATGAAATATGAAATAPQSTQLTNKLPARPMRTILESLNPAYRPTYYGGMVRKTRKHKRMTKRKRNAKHTHRKHSKSSKRKSYRHF